MWLFLVSAASSIYFINRIIGDAKAVKNGTIHKRVAKRAATRVAFKGINKMFK